MSAVTLTVPGAELAGALRQILPAIGTDKKRPQLHGVLAEASGGVLRLVATDATRLAVRELSVAAPDLRVVLDGKSLADVMAWLDGDGDVTIGIEDDACTFTAADGSARSVASLGGDFPNYEPLLAAPDDSPRTTVRRDDVLAVLDRLPDAPFARLRFDAAGLAITADEVTEAVAGAHAGEPVVLSVDPERLLDAVIAFDEAALEVAVTTPVAPIVITASAGGPLTYVVMPVRTT